MSLLSGLLQGNLSSNITDAERRDTQVLAQLLKIIKVLGWDSLVDIRSITPNLRATQVYLRKHTKTLQQLYQLDFEHITRDTLIDTINPLLLTYWHIQIVGSPTNAHLERLIPN